MTEYLVRHDVIVEAENVQHAAWKARQTELDPRVRRIIFTVGPLEGDVTSDNGTWEYVEVSYTGIAKRLERKP